MVLPRSERVVEVHLVVEGGCWTGLAGAAPERASAGDVVVFPPHDRHSLPTVARFGEDGAPGTRFVCGFLGCDARPFNSLLEARRACCTCPRSAARWRPGALGFGRGGGATGERRGGARASPR